MAFSDLVATAIACGLRPANMVRCTFSVRGRRRRRGPRSIDGPVRPGCAYDDPHTDPPTLPVARGPVAPDGDPSRAPVGPDRRTGARAPADTPPATARGAGSPPRRTTPCDGTGPRRPLILEGTPRQESQTQ